MTLRSIGSAHTLIPACCVQAQFKCYEKMGELWERLLRREAKEAKKGGDPLSKPEVQFMSGMLHEFLQVSHLASLFGTTVVTFQN